MTANADAPAIAKSHGTPSTVGGQPIDPTGQKDETDSQARLRIVTGVGWRGWQFDVMAGSLAVAVAVVFSVAAVRRWPAPVVGVQMVLLVASAYTKTSFVAPLALVMVLVALGSLAYRSGWVAIGLAYAFTFLATLLFTVGKSVGPATLDPVRTVGWVGLTAGAVAFGRYLRGVRDVAEITEERATEAQVWRGVETRAARLAERSRLARDLHDIVAHHVGAMTLRASSGRLALDTSGDTAAARAALADVATAGRQVLDELRGLLTVLRDPDAIDDEPLVTEPKAAMADAVARVRAAGVPVNLDLDPRLGDVSLLVRATVARIVQEALTNVEKHAHASTVRVALAINAHELWLEVADDGRGFDDTVAASRGGQTGLGIVGMKYRARLLGGECHLESGRDGTRVTVRLPLERHVGGVRVRPRVQGS